MRKFNQAPSSKSWFSGAAGQLSAIGESLETKQPILLDRLNRSGVSDTVKSSITDNFSIDINTEYRNEK
jgi:hypothetical protein